MSKKLTRLQKAGALVSMAVLVGAWGVAVGSSGLATAVSGTSTSIPEVPAMALEQPASVQRVTSALNPQAGAVGALSTLSTNGIPSAALYAYHHAETLLADADPQCKLPWNLVAAIGRVESNHGRSEGNALNAEGLTTPGIIGEPLNGAGNAKKVVDSDHGRLDEDKSFDRPIGPFQFMPEIWQKTAIDSDSDGSVNPQDIDDAATTAGIFLCSGEGDLSTDPGARAAVKRYNSTASYVDLVMKVSASYASGFYSQTPDGYSTSTLLTSQAFDQTLSDEEREEAEEEQEEADEEAEEQEEQEEQQQSGGGGTDGGGDNGSGDGGSGDGDGGDGDGDGGDGDGGDDGDDKPSLGGGLDDVLDSVTGEDDEDDEESDDLGDVVEDTLDGVEDLLDGDK